MEAIDFRELRRQERQRIRVQSTAGCHSISSNDGGEDDGKITNDGIIAASTSLSNEHIQSYTCLLHHGLIVDDLYRVAGTRSIIDSVFYAQHFLSSKQEKEVMKFLSSIPEYTQHSSCREVIAKNEREESIQHNGKWTRLHHAKRKVALFDGTICSLPLILQRLANTLVDIGAFPSTHPPNHVLINEYQPGEGIMPHTDGPAYDSRTATISLGGSDVIFKLWPRKKPSNYDDMHIAQEVILHGHGSLVLFTDDAYINHCHEISEGVLEERLSSDGTLVKRGYRISLTFRRKK
jgi:alkylated DNA repair protein alkB family protein 6